MLNLIDGLTLSQNSQYVQALMEDDEYAAAVLDADMPASLAPALADWPPEVDMLAKVVDLLQQQVRQFASANGGKGGRFEPTPGPETAIERVRRLRVRAEYDYLMSLMEPADDDT